MSDNNYKPLKPFKFWCQTVLPTVYDDSLSYYELLNKVVDYLNLMGENIEGMHSDVVDYETKFNELKTYVDQYFENLDVQTEINGKLDAMAENGELSALLAPFIPDLVTDWLDKHITPTSPVVDDSFTIEGAAADSLAVGTKTFNRLDAENLPEYITPINFGANKFAYVLGSKIDAQYKPAALSDTATCMVIQNNFTNNRWNFVIVDGIHHVRYIRNVSRTSDGNNGWNYDISDIIIEDSLNKDTIMFTKYNVADDVSASNKLHLYDITPGTYCNISPTYLDSSPLTTTEQVLVQCEKINNNGQVRLVKLYDRYMNEYSCSVNYSVNQWIYSEWELRGTGTFNEMSGINIMASNKHLYFDDFDNAPDNKTFVIYVNAQLKHSPFGDGIVTANHSQYNSLRDIKGYPAGTLTTYRGGSGSYKHQIFVRGTLSGPSTGYLTPTNVIINFRTYYDISGWSEWKSVSDMLTLTATNTAVQNYLIAPYIDNITNLPTRNQYDATDRENTANPEYLHFKEKYLDQNGNPVSERVVVRNENNNITWVSPLNPEYNCVFDDFNNAPANTIYQIDLNCTADVMDNNPFPGKSSVLMTINYSYVSRHGAIQICIGNPSGGTCQMAFRYGYQQSASVYNWTVWTYIADSARRLVVTPGTDLSATSGDWYCYGRKDSFVDFATGGIFADFPVSISNSTYLYIEKKQLLPTSDAALYTFTGASLKVECWRAGSPRNNSWKIFSYTTA